MRDRRPGRHTKLITITCIVAVVVAGAFAISANLGILEASTDDEIGSLAAAGDLTPTTNAASAPAVTSTTNAAPAPAVAPTTASMPQTYVVDVAGTITVKRTGDAVVVDTVEPNPGWTWIAGPSDETHIEVTFTDGNRTLWFTATGTAHGTLDATLADATPTPVAPPATAAALDDDTEEHDEEEHEHEGWDDDD